MATKRNNAANGDVIVERVLTSDAFLAREIKKAPLKTKNGSLTADLKHLPNDLKITIQGAREHNLKNVDLEFPRNRMVVFTGLSGSGKSSLAFDTLFAEGQRRYVESLSAYARQFLGQMDKPDVDFIEGLSPAVSIDQKTTNRNPRSTVGTITEIYDYLRLLFARTGIPHCPVCTGIGYKLEIDPELVIPDPSKTLNENAIEPWGMTKGTGEYYRHVLEGLGDEMGFDLDTPWKDLPEEARQAIMYGRDFKVQVSYRNRWGRMREYSTGFEGVVRTLMRRHDETDSDQMKQYYESYMREVPCQACQGRRLRPEVLAVTVGGESIADVCDMSAETSLAWMDGLQLEGSAAQIAGEVLKEIRARLGFLNDVGLNYLTLSRAAKTLSGGEAQRIRLATQIGSGLVGVMYVLDEPSIGLHQRDNERLITTLHHLRDLGNTLIVVEHDEDTIKNADWVIDIGPGAGEHGGEVIYSGPAKKLVDAPRSVTGDYIAGRRKIEVPQSRRKVRKTKQLRVVGARENNLKDLTVNFPLGVFTCVTGVSGSGKSTLVNQILYPVLADKLNGARIVPGKHTRVEGVGQCDKVIHVDQNPIGRTPRSNPATYTGVWDKIRTLFAKTPEAQVRGYGPGRFSFNVKGGRCEACHGDGTLKIEMNFLPDVYVDCEECHGKRYNRETLEVKYNGKSVADVLGMPIEEAAQFFKAYPSISRYLDTLVQVGLGYIRLGQPAPTLSGGESQRVKLATELQRRSTGKTVYILDEPTTGLHFEDVRKLLLVLQGLVDKGNTVIVIEHNLDVVKSADWIIDLGPEGGDGGGTIVTEGTPEQVAQCEQSWTGKFLKGML